MTANPHMTLAEVIEDMLENGMSLEAAEQAAPFLLPLLNDPRGFVAALKEHPALCDLVRKGGGDERRGSRLAERLGLPRRH